MFQVSRFKFQVLNDWRQAPVILNNLIGCISDEYRFIERKALMTVGNLCLKQNALMLKVKMLND